jgi:phage shock protein A
VPRLIGAVALATALFSIGGCGFVAPGRYERSVGYYRSLQAENAQLKDVEARLRTKYNDLARRTRADEGLARDQAERIAALEESVAAYRRDRDRMATAFEQLRGEVDDNLERASAQP